MRFFYSQILRQLQNNVIQPKNIQPIPIPNAYRHPLGSWDKPCLHRGDSDTDVSDNDLSPRGPCPACIDAGEAVSVTRPSACGEFEFVSYKGRAYVACLICRGWGDPLTDHKCQGEKTKPDPELGGYHPTLVDLLAARHHEAQFVAQPDA